MNTNFIFAILSLGALAGKESTQLAERRPQTEPEPYDALRAEVTRSVLSTYQLLTFSAPARKPSDRDRW